MSVENLDEIIPVVDGLADNKAAVFAYTEQAYQDNDVNGVSQYDFSKEQNIPDRNSTDTNGQVLTKGFRSQGSSIARNFFNHFIGRFSYNLNKTVDMFKSFLASYKTDYRKNGFMYNATLQYQVGDVCMDVWTDNTFAFFIRTGNGGSAGVRPMVADGEHWTTSEHWACMGSYANTTQSFALRDKTGKIQVADPTDNLDAANKTYVDTKASSEADTVQTNLTNHINNQASGVHGSTSAATASKLIIRDSAGRAQVASPSEDSDIATKKYVDDTASGDAGAVQTNLTNHINNQAAGVHGAVSTPTANKIIIRDGSGRAQVTSPSAGNDIANKSYVDNKTWNANDITAGTLPIARGGTGATTAAGVLTNLGITATAAELNYVDGVTSNIQTQLNAKATTSALNAHTGATTGVHGATSAATANKIIIRDASGRAQVATPSASTDIANKNYVDSKVSSAPGKPRASTNHLSSGTKPVTPGWYTVEFWGGGGGGGNGSNGNMGTGGGGGGGGGGGEYIYLVIYISESPIDVTIGAGGAAGSNGGTTSVTIGGHTFKAKGGAGGANGSTGNGGNGGNGGGSGSSFYYGGKGGNAGAPGTYGGGNNGRVYGNKSLGGAGGAAGTGASGGGGGGGSALGNGGDGGKGGNAGDSGSAGNNGVYGSGGGGGGGGGITKAGKVGTGGKGGTGGNGIVILTPLTM